MTLLAQPKKRLLTIDDFLSRPDDCDYELVDGALVEKKPMGALSEYIALQIAVALTVFCRKTNAGHVFPSDTLYRCFGNPRTGRKGDVSFIRRGRLPDERIPQGAIDIPADLIVEVVSPTDLAYDVEAKSKLYLENGFGELWIAFPNTQTMHVRKPGTGAVILGATDILRGSGALDRFSCRPQEFFPA